MPLSEPADREPIHERRVTCRGYRRSDGLWDIEGHIVDVKTYDFESADRGTLRAGDPVHEMRMRITVDDEFLVHDAEADTEHAPYAICPAAAPPMNRIKGLRIGPGWHREINRRVGGALGCTHLRELLGPMATTAFQTIVPIKARQNQGAAGKQASLIGSCYAYAPDSPVVRRLWPEQYREPGQAESGE